MSGQSRADVEPIGAESVTEVARFLQENTHEGLTAEDWQRTIAPSWTSAAPNHGFLLRSAGHVVGVYLAYYSTRSVDGRDLSVCNLATWVVHEDHRIASLRLLRALLAQDHDLFTDVSPSPKVVRINERIGFESLSQVGQRVPNVPRMSLRRRIRVVTRPAEIESLLTGAVLQQYLDHREIDKLEHLVVVADGKPCYVAYRAYPDLALGRVMVALRQRGVVAILHVSDRDVFRTVGPRVFSWFLFRYGRLFTLIEERVAGFRPRFSKPAGIRLDRMYRGEGFPDEAIDYLYSELMFIERTVGSPESNG
jgi:hypothetical protein